MKTKINKNNTFLDLGIEFPKKCMLCWKLCPLNNIFFVQGNCGCITHCIQCEKKKEQKNCPNVNCWSKNTYPSHLYSTHPFKYTTGGSNSGSGSGSGSNSSSNNVISLLE